MQPNEQEPTQPPATPSAQPGGYPDAPVSPSVPTPAAPPQTPPGTIAPSFATPDFFQLDPIADPMLAVEAKKRKKKVLIIAAIVVAVAAVMAFLGYLLLLYNSPQERFYRVLEKQLSVPYMTEDITLKGDGISSNTSISYDFTDRQGPRYEGVFTYSGKETLQTEEIRTGEKNHFSRILQMPVSTQKHLEGMGIKVGKWHSIPLVDIDSSILESQYVNSHNPVLISGSLGQEDITHVIHDFKNADTYNVQSANSTKNTTVYVVTVDASRVVASNASLSGRQDERMPSMIRAGISDSTKFILTVNNTTNLVEGINFTLNKNIAQGNGYTECVVTIKYPSTLKIKEVTNEDN